MESRTSGSRDMMSIELLIENSGVAYIDSVEEYNDVDLTRLSFNDTTSELSDSAERDCDDDFNEDTSDY